MAESQEEAIISRIAKQVSGLGSLLVMVMGAAVALIAIWERLGAVQRFGFVAGCMIFFAASAIGIGASRNELRREREARMTERSQLRRAVSSILGALGVKIWGGNLVPNEVSRFQGEAAEHASRILALLEEDRALAKSLESDLNTSDLDGSWGKPR